MFNREFGTSCQIGFGFNSFYSCLIEKISSLICKDSGIYFSDALQDVDFLIPRCQVADFILR
jgi:hypothetical protein